MIAVAKHQLSKKCSLLLFCKDIKTIFMAEKELA